MNWPIISGDWAKKRTAKKKERKNYYELNWTNSIVGKIFHFELCCVAINCQDVVGQRQKHAAQQNRTLPHDVDISGI